MIDLSIFTFPRDNSRGRKVNPGSNVGSLGGSAKNSARGNGYSFKAGPPEEDPATKDASPGRHLDQIFNRGIAQERRAEPARESNPGVSAWIVSDPKASLNNLYQIKESRIEEASQLGDLSYDINLAINDPNPNLMRKKSLRELMNEDSDKKNPEKSDSLRGTAGVGVGIEGHPNRATYAENMNLSAKTSQMTRPTHLQAVGIQDLEIPPEN